MIYLFKSQFEQLCPVPYVVCPCFKLDVAIVPFSVIFLLIFWGGTAIALIIILVTFLLLFAEGMFSLYLCL